MYHKYSCWTSLKSSARLLQSSSRCKGLWYPKVKDLTRFGVHGLGTNRNMTGLSSMFTFRSRSSCISPTARSEGRHGARMESFYSTWFQDIEGLLCTLRWFCFSGERSKSVGLHIWSFFRSVVDKKAPRHKIAHCHFGCIRIPQSSQ